MNILTKKYLGLVFFWSVAVTNIFAIIGADNPDGPAGTFEGSGMSTTAGSINTYTANASRSVTDLVVAGGVGSYPLAFSRISNSRYLVGVDDTGNGLAADFGSSGNWLHSYQWAIDSKTKASGKPTSFTVRYPDGRVTTFAAAGTCGGNPPPGCGDPYYRSGLGIRDRLQIFWDSSTAGRAYLIMPDGGKVWFSIAITHPSGCGGCILYTYTVQGIIDAYGQTTTIAGSPTSGPVTITEPGGRWIKLYYTTPPANPNAHMIYQVTSSDGRTVQYSYTYNGVQVDPILTQVAYFNDPALVATYTYQADNSSSGGNDLLRTAVDPMYSGPMWKIAYTYATGLNPDGTGVVYGQIQSENYYDGTNVGVALSTLTVVNNTTRTETRADGKSRTFTYNTTPLLTSWTDFKGNSASQTYDSNGFINSVTDFNGHTTNYTNNAFTGARLTTTFPSTPADTPAGTPRGVVTYTYGSASCADVNNRDANNPYYVCSATDEGGHTTTYTRDTAKRVTQVNYPDGGSESFQYNSFGQVTSHTMRTGGVETSGYDARGLLQMYRDSYHATGNPNVWYQYDSLDRISGVTDTLGTGAGDVNHTTNFAYNSRGDIATTTLPVDPIDGQRHTITKTYNLANGTVSSVTDQLGHTTSFTYDDYKRLRTTTTPPRFAGDSMNHTSTVYYDANGTGDDYTRVDAQVTHITSPAGKKATILYDDNRLKTSVTIAVGTSDAATTTFGYDLNGNLTSVVAPKEQPGQPFAGQSTITTYDERDRPYSVTDPLGNVTSCTYDAAGHKKSVTRANGQVVTFDSFDAMNRLLQSTAKQTPDPDAVTKYTYYTSGLLHTMQDPRLIAINSTDNYSYQYDLMGRKTSLTYPVDTLGVHRSESWHYDTAGRIDTFTNRNGNTQRTIYDSLSRPVNIAWDDSGLTPTVTLSYELASRVTAINNANANISHAYFDDGLLSSETTTYADSVARTVSYTYDADANRASIQYPNSAYTFTFDYNGRNQLAHVLNNSTAVVTAAYDIDGNLTARTLDNSTISSFTYDGLDRLTHISHALNGTTPTFDYAYDSVSNRKWTKRDGANGDVFGYDLADQSTSVLLNVANPDTTSPGAQTISYDANGNRTTFSPYGSTDTYTTNNLNQYTQRNSSMANYDTKGNMTTGFDASLYGYDAQDRILSASKGGTTETFTYDGLNRQVSRTIGAGQPVYNVYDGWNLIGEYSFGSTSPTVAYLGGVKNLTSNRYYYSDGSGSTSHLTDSTGHLLEWYRYDLQGTPIFSGGGNSSAFGVRHLFTGQQWYGELGLYDLRNRFYSPDTGRFLQTDPIGFSGDVTNLYRYAGNNAVNYADPFGLWTVQVGFSGTTQIGPLTISGSGGIVFDGHGNIGTYGTTFGGGGFGADADGGLSVAGSNADTIFGLSGLFAQAGAEGGVGLHVGVDGFTGNDNTNGSIVNGGGFTIGWGAGAGFYGGASVTGIIPLVGAPPQQQTGWTDGQRVIVTAPDINPTSGGPGGSGYGFSFSNAFNNANRSGVSASASMIGAAHVASAEASAAIEMGGWATSGDPMRSPAVSESANAGDGGPSGPIMTWVDTRPRYATAYKWHANSTSWVINSGGVKGYYTAIAWSTDPAAYVAPPTTTPSGRPIGRSSIHDGLSIFGHRPRAR